MDRRPLNHLRVRAAGHPGLPMHERLECTLHGTRAMRTCGACGRFEWCTACERRPQHYCSSRFSVSTPRSAILALNAREFRERKQALRFRRSKFCFERGGVHGNCGMFGAHRTNAEIIEQRTSAQDEAAHRDALDTAAQRRKSKRRQRRGTVR